MLTYLICREILQMRYEYQKQIKVIFKPSELLNHINLFIYILSQFYAFIFLNLADHCWTLFIHNMQNQWFHHGNPQNPHTKHYVQSYRIHSLIHSVIHSHNIIPKSRMKRC